MFAYTHMQNNTESCAYDIYNIVYVCATTCMSVFLPACLPVYLSMYLSLFLGSLPLNPFLEDAGLFED